MFFKIPSDLQKSPVGEIVKMKGACLGLLEMMCRQRKGSTTYDARFDEATGVDADHNSSVIEAVKVDFLPAVIERRAMLQVAKSSLCHNLRGSRPATALMLRMRTNNDVRLAD